MFFYFGSLQCKTPAVQLYVKVLTYIKDKRALLAAMWADEPGQTKMTVPLMKNVFVLVFFLGPLLVLFLKHTRRGQCNVSFVSRTCNNWLFNKRWLFCCSSSQVISLFCTALTLERYTVDLIKKLIMINKWARQHEMRWSYIVSVRWYLETDSKVDNTWVQ